MKIVIVEDETRIREGIEKLIKRISDEYEMIALAENGEEGLQTIIENKPEIVVTDIKMPKMDGIEMLTRLKEISKMPKVIVLSAYSDFEYARQAIKLGVSEYILKPISVIEFTNSFKSLCKQIKDEKEKENSIFKTESLDFIIEQELYYGNQIDEHIKRALLERYQFDIEKESCLVTVYFGRRYERLKEEVKEELENVLKYNSMTKYLILDLAREKRLLVLFYQYEDIKKIERWFQNSIVSFVMDKFGDYACFGWAKIEKIKEIKNVYKTLSKAMDWNIVLGKGIMISYPKVLQIQGNLVSYPLFIEQEVKESICADNWEKVERKIIEFLNYFKRGILYSPQEVKECFVRFVWGILNVIKEVNHLCYDKFEQQVLLDQIMNAITFWELEETVYEVLGVLKDNSMIDGRKESLLIQRMKSLVHEFYNQGITLDEIAVELQKTPEYLGTQFHKEVGMTYSSYVKRYRIEKAKKLLLGTDLKIYKIAEQVGYQDPKYFSKVFKELEGKLPGEYRGK